MKYTVTKFLMIGFKSYSVPTPLPSVVLSCPCVENCSNFFGVQPLWRLEDLVGLGVGGLINHYM